ncbi:DUF445 domain-containing protein [Candidatus Formimonas warabiya]|uniref:DUF445 family protein n=1 Tax=Formimonas warabiya TaxID=1761012 RepID=A0A3G1KN48_FORW1|nr:DUF445 family protein [Candidatus Formimonas warabiya]ATW23921.1 hypothetical protein DCMF_03115 [Candidatus Formimonas warabiya]
MWLQLITIPLVGALIGWITNVLAIKLIFRPYRPVRIPLLHYQIQGLIPKRREELAVNVGQVIGNELLSWDDVLSKLNQKSIKERIVKSVVETVMQKLDERTPSLVPHSLKKLFLGIVEDILYKETPGMINNFLMDFSGKVKDEIDFPHMIQDKINNYDLHELERVILLIASRELKHIEILGGVLGFVIGVVQALLFYLFE